MLETIAAQLHYTAWVIFGLPFSARALDRLVEALLATHREFGAVARRHRAAGRASAQRGTRREMQIHRFRTQATRAAHETAYYARQFERLSLDTARLRYEDIQRIPLTPKEALRDDPDAFVRQTAQVARPGPPILVTKLFLPRRRPDLVARPRLLARLDAARNVPLTLVAAPAGFGKTTLLAQALGGGSWGGEEHRPQPPTLNSQPPLSRMALA